MTFEIILTEKLAQHFVIYCDDSCEIRESSCTHTCLMSPVWKGCGIFFCLFVSEHRKRQFQNMYRIKHSVFLSLVICINEVPHNPELMNNLDQCI